MDLLVCLATFVRVADTGSFTVTARDSVCSPSAVTRQIAQLEEHFGVRLLHRSTRHVSLTDDGHSLLERARTLLGEANALDELLGCHRDAPAGMVRLGVSAAGAHFLGPRLPALLKKHPDLTVDIHVSDEDIDLVENGIDVALRAGEQGDSALIERRIATVSPILVASPAYLSQAGTPREPDELAHHCCVISSRLATIAPGWQLTGPDGSVPTEVHGPMTVNNLWLATKIALCDHGIVLLPAFMARDYLLDGRLVRVLPQYTGPTLNIYLVYPSRRFLPSRTRVVIDFIMDQFNNVQGFDNGIHEGCPPRLAA